MPLLFCYSSSVTDDFTTAGECFFIEFCINREVYFFQIAALVKGSQTQFFYTASNVDFPQVAADLQKGYTSKEILEKALIETVRQPLAARVYANYLATPGSSFNENTYSLRRHSYMISRKENARETSVPPWLEWTGADKVETVPVMQQGKTAIIITGDANRNKTMCVAGGGFTSVKIELPRNWDELMAKAGYKPLSSFYLTSELAPSSQPQQFYNYRQRRPQGQQRQQNRYRSY